MVSTSKINNFFRKARRAPWILGQRLVSEPSSFDSAVSDLFIWINDEEWKTYFELIDIYSLFENRPSGIYLHLFDKNGETLSKKEIDLHSHSQIRIDISKLLPTGSGNFGTFSIFHKSSPTSIIQNNSYISERGYTGYQFKSSKLLSYVHGNHDAIAYNRETQLTEILGSASFFRRKFNLQYLLESGHEYFIGIVNNSNSIQNIKLSVINNKNQSIVMHYNEFELKPKGINFSQVQLDNGKTGRLVINSKLVMSRPTIIRIRGNSMDVFHG